MSDDDSETTVSTALPPLRSRGPANLSIVGGLFEVYFQIPWDGQHQVWLDFYVNNARVDGFAGEWFYGRTEHWRALGSSQPGSARIWARWRSGNEYSPPIEIYIWISNRPVIVSPASNAVVTDRRPRISGTGGGNCSLRVVQTNTGVPLSDVFTATNNNWAVTLNRDLPYGDYSIAIEQSQAGYATRYSENRPFRVVGATISSPAQNAIVALPEILFKGEGLPGSTITVVKQANHYDVVSQSVTVGTNQTWQAAPKPGLTLPSGPLTVEAQYVMAGISNGYSPPVTISVLGIPTITTPGGIVDTTFSVAGNNGFQGAVVQIFIDLSDTLVGETGVFSAPGWGRSVILQPGPVRLVARQSTQGVFSLRSAPVTFKVRPPQLTSVTVTPLANASLRFSGTGYAGATVDVVKVSGPGSQTVPSVGVSDAGIWQVDSVNWPLGQYSFKATQKVSDNSGGWIVSTEYTFSYTVVLPRPTVSYTGGYTPVFSGTGYNGATVVLLNPGGSSSGVPNALVSGGRWSSTASEVWGPTLKRKLHLRQELGGQVSEGWVEIEVTIAPLAPVIDDITVIEDGQHSPIFKGTCWDDAQVKLRFSDNAQEHQATVTGTQWTFKRSTPFAPDVYHEVTATQRAAGQDSPAAALRFSLERFIPQPVFTAPVEGSEVGRNPLVTGSGGIAGGKIELHDAQFTGLVGESDSLIADGNWEVQLNNLAFRDYTLTAVQLMGGRTSEFSAEHSFRVVVLPPEIEVPAPDGTLPRIARISGKGLPGARVDVWLQGVADPILTGISVDTNGLWQSAAITLDIGRHSLRARQTFDGRPSKDSPVQAFRVVPVAPIIETPVDAAAVGRGVVVSGFGHPGDTVAVALSTAPQTVLGRAPVLADRTWSMAVELVVAAGDHDLIAIASSGEFQSGSSLPRKVRVGPYLPSIDVPAPSRWVTDPVAFAGKGQPGVGELVSWFNPERVVARDIAVTASGWQSDATIRLPQGGYWVRFRQVIGSGGSAIHSDWADSRRFEVVPSPPGLPATKARADER
ncbi:hypothetical protein [Pseudomonas sp. dw_612]|uniref:hypothetical protein n=1 Tax=Pseudomonas sp. dw_612 TaxID=2720080 RepID=UPI002116B7BD|nr:hypothetical protein [Pseudomonas sp. dw_612]